MKKRIASTMFVLLSATVVRADTVEVTPTGGATDTRYFDGIVRIGDIDLSTVSNNELVFGAGDFIRVSDTEGSNSQRAA